MMSTLSLAVPTSPLGDELESTEDVESGIFFRSGLDTDLLICPTGCLRKALLRLKALPSSVIDLHPQSPDIDFIAAKTSCHDLPRFSSCVTAIRRQTAYRA